VIGNFPIFRCALLVVLPLLVASGCNRRPKGGSFPASNEVAGWVKTGDVRAFQAVDLWKYIDGEAERYLKAGVQTVSTADYRFQNKFDAVVDIYSMKSVAGIQSILESEPAAGAEPINLGDGARLFSQSLVFRRGLYLVRVTAYEESAETGSALLALGRGIEQRLTR
jgi:hypothetical protein